MDILTNRRIESYDYNSRYATVPYFFNTVDKRQIYGIGTAFDKNIQWVLHVVKQQDTLDRLALQYFGNPTFWWIIAYFNDIQDAFENLSAKFRTIKIPSISKISFGADR